MEVRLFVNKNELRIVLSKYGIKMSNVKYSLIRNIRKSVSNSLFTDTLQQKLLFHSFEINL